MKPKMWLFEKINKIDKSLARMIEKKKWNAQLPISTMKEKLSLQNLQLFKRQRNNSNDLCQ